jgi:hypothetical protein
MSKGRWSPTPEEERRGGKAKEKKVGGNKLLQLAEIEGEKKGKK